MMGSLHRIDPLTWSAYKGQPAYRTIRDKYLAAIGNRAWTALLDQLLTMPAPLTQYAYQPLAAWDFAVAPGSGAHHTHFGGLALHTLQNLEYAEAWAGLYATRGIPLDKDLLYATIIAHDTMKRFIYKFDDAGAFVKAEDAFIAKQEDHHSWVLRELGARGCDRELILSVAAIHGIDDVSLADGVKGVAIVNHYLTLGGVGLEYTVDDVRPEHVVAFLADSDWHWSGQAQRKAGKLAELMAGGLGASQLLLKLYLGSRFSFEMVGAYIEKNGYQGAQAYFNEALNKTGLQ